MKTIADGYEPASSSSTALANHRCAPTRDRGPPLLAVIAKRILGASPSFSIQIVLQLVLCAFAGITVIRRRSRRRRRKFRWLSSCVSGANRVNGLTDAQNRSSSQMSFGLLNSEQDLILQPNLTRNISPIDSPSIQGCPNLIVSTTQLLAEHRPRAKGHTDQTASLR